MKNAFIVLALVWLAGCVTIPYEPQAREVKRRPTAGGAIALNQNYRSEDRARADIMMKANCGNGDVKIVEEGEVVVGERAEATTGKNSTQTRNAFTLGGLTFGERKPAETTTTQTVQVKEWQIAYDCIAAVATPASVVSKSKNAQTQKN